MVPWFVILMANMIKSLGSEPNFNSHTPAFRGERIHYLDPFIPARGFFFENELVFNQESKSVPERLIFGSEDLPHFVQIHLVMLLEKEQDRNTISVSHHAERYAIEIEWMNHSNDLGESGT
jgi:hypothetical protein